MQTLSHYLKDIENSRVRFVSGLNRYGGVSLPIFFRDCEFGKPISIVRVFIEFIFLVLSSFSHETRIR